MIIRNDNKMGAHKLGGRSGGTNGKTSRKGKHGQTEEPTFG